MLTNGARARGAAGGASSIPVRRAAFRLSRCLFPPRCLLCNAPGDGGLDLCAGCLGDLPRNGTACRRCAEPLPAWPGREAAARTTCGRCQRRPPAFARTLAPLLYADPTDRLIQQLKFHERLAVAPLLAELLAAAVGEDLRRDADAPAPRPQAVLAVPLHPRRARARGYNQALEIARPLARALRLPLLNGALRRRVDSAPQRELPLRQRRRALRRAFVAPRPPGYHCVAVVDDVMTTGSTADAAARALLAAGVARVEIWACSRTAAC